VKTTAAVKDLAARALDLDGLTRGGGSDLKDRLEDFKRRAPSAPAAPPPINLAPSLRAVGPDTYSISSDDVDALWEHLPALSTQARILPVRIGETMALRVSSVEPNSVWSRLGFVSGDVVETVDGFSTSTPEAALEAYQHMKETETVRVQVRRDGVLRTMTYHRLKASTATEPPQP
jgi:S1-C subfamily serine protease